MQKDTPTAEPSGEAEPSGVPDTEPLPVLDAVPEGVPLKSELSVEDGEGMEGRAVTVTEGEPVGEEV